MRCAGSSQRLQYTSNTSLASGRGWAPNDHNAALNWIEAFADGTTEAVRRRDAEAARAQTNFIAAAYRAEPDALRTIVDVPYAEDLMQDSSADDNTWAGRLIAEQIRQLSTDMWGARQAQKNPAVSTPPGKDHPLRGWMETPRLPELRGRYCVRAGCRASGTRCSNPNSNVRTILIASGPR